MYKTDFWMKHFHHSTAKRTRVWSTSWMITALNRGRLSRKSHKNKNKLRTSRRYVDGSGVNRFTATRHLKGTQILARTRHDFVGCFLWGKTHGRSARCSGGTLRPSLQSFSTSAQLCCTTSPTCSHLAAVKPFCHTWMPDL